jgi:hypothetical protein
MHEARSVAFSHRGILFPTNETVAGMLAQRDALHFPEAEFFVKPDGEVIGTNPNARSESCAFAQESIARRASAIK